MIEQGIDWKGRDKGGMKELRGRLVDILGGQGSLGGNVYGFLAIGVCVLRHF